MSASGQPSSAGLDGGVGGADLLLLLLVVVARLYVVLAVLVLGRVEDALWGFCSLVKFGGF